MTDDVVTELDRYLVRDETVGFTEMVQRARDEIVALRARLDRIGEYNRSQAKAVDDLFAAQRAEVLAAESLREGHVRKGGLNPAQSQVRERPAPPEPMRAASRSALKGGEKRGG